VSERYKEMWEDAFHDNLEKKAEISELKAEVELWKLRSNNWQKFCGLTRPEMTDELNRLKAEVDRLTSIVGADAIDREHGMCCDASAQVERLTKAGDELERVLTSRISSYEVGNASFQWRAAKGVQP
jgi:hypothetical protein